MNLFDSEKSSGTRFHTFDLPEADIILYEHFFTKQESDDLFERLVETTKWQQDYIKIYGKTVNLPRLTAWYGDKDYTYSGITMKVHPWTSQLLFIKSRVEEQTGLRFTGVLLNYYRSGQDSVSWHSDDEKELGLNPVIASVSFGATRAFQMRHKTRKDITKILLALSHGSLLLMRGSTQHHWEHQIPKTAKTVAPRINLTFRVI